MSTCKRGGKGGENAAGNKKGRKVKSQGGLNEDDLTKVGGAQPSRGSG